MKPTDLLARWREDPLLFVYDNWPNLTLRPWQVKLFLAWVKFLKAAVVGARASGKSKVAALAALHHLVANVDATVVVVCPTERQVRGGLFAEIRSLWMTSSTLPRLFPDWVVGITSITTSRPHWRCIGMSSDQPQALEGLHSAADVPALVIIDESAYLPDDFFSSLMGMLEHKAARILALGTGGPPGSWFAKIFSGDGHYSDWFTMRVPASEVPELAARYEAEMRRVGALDPRFLQQWEAKFTQANTWGLFTLPQLMKAVGAPDPDAGKDDPFHHTGPPRRRVIGVDVARRVDDSVACFVQGKVVKGFEVLPRTDDVHLLGASVIIAARKFRARTVVVDEIGVGGFLCSYLQEALLQDEIDVVPFNASERADDSDRHFNRKTEVLIALRKMVDDGAISLPDDDRLLRELCGFELRQIGPRLKVDDPKHDSPDFADSLIMALSQQVCEPDVVSYKSIDPIAIPNLIGPLIRGGR